MRCKSQLHKYHEITYLFDKLFHEVQLYMRLAIASKAFFTKEPIAIGLTVRQLKRNLSWVKTAWGRSASIYSLYNINLRLNPSTSSSNIVCYNLMNYTKIGWPVLNNCFKCYIVSLLASYLSIIIYLASLLTITLI